ncbi:aminotransferase class I/II-fold pyridoxal phosphate-dependent enzyme [Nocardia brasiliensis]|uniref:aminotransferase class I/II-fold pyridoxal phosphate-dependent enzyme n=1 Tax=Nocardia brasiliensis TaxID=37326 RepID=UPI0018946910|nr:aminotransferase class I/II-fold pyridoxal phosphate-dependent enzyme [Nocardia brasiliensis]MBF6541465.1 aminotransferase class I/II-fold pyridoxal phosphate-dependent enzyme [Nocardia brasiliensis]
MTELRLDDLHPMLTAPASETMNFLNEIANRFPDAVSFAPGRPYQELFETDAVPRYLDTYCRYLREQRGYSEALIRQTLFQYGRTKGIVHELIAEQLRLDEGIEIDPESIVVTVGCQEAMVLVLRALRTDDRDVVLAVAPTYVGFTGAAGLVDLPVLPVAGGARGIDLDDLTAQVTAAKQAGRRPRALYLVPDFSNPTGISLDRTTRRELLDLAEQLDLLVLEDNPYGLFRAADAEHTPTLKALDTRNRVVYLGSFAKTGLPGARVGFVVADQPVRDGGRAAGIFADQLAKIKSMLTVNTSPIAQAVIGGKLLEHGCSMIRANAAEIEVYRRNLRHLLDGLSARFAGTRVRWNSPQGGFFVVVDVGFPVDDALLERSAEHYGVLWTPMSHFYVRDIALHQLRLSCSSLTTEQIDLGLDRLAALVHDHTYRKDPTMSSPNDPGAQSRVRRIISEVLEIADTHIGESADFYDDLAANSLDKAQILARLEKEFDIQFDPDQSAAIMSLGDATRVLSSIAGSRS